MWRWLIGIGGGAVLVVALLGAVFVLGMRTSWPPVVDAVRRFNRAVTNPRVIGSAGSVGASASLIKHRGRQTGTTHSTPIGAIPTPNGFIVLLPYGTRADWLKNVLAAGSATLVHEGETIEVTKPEIVETAEVIELLPPGDRRMVPLFGVDHCLRVRRSDGPV